MKKHQNYKFYINVIKKSGLSWVILTFFSMIHHNTASAQTAAGARAFSLGQAGIALNNDLWALFQNPALMKTEQRSVSFYAMRFAGLQELTDLSATVTLPLDKGAFGAGLHRHGFDLFNETTVHIGFKRQFGAFSLGLKGSGYHVRIGGGYGSARAAGISGGLAMFIGDYLTVGSRITNFNHPVYGSSGEELQREMGVGLSYAPSSVVTMVTELSKDVRFPVSIRSGIEIQLIDSFSIRTGFTTEPLSWSAGLGIQLDFLNVNIAVQKHGFLGISPAVDTGIIF